MIHQNILIYQYVLHNKRSKASLRIDTDRLTRGSSGWGRDRVWMGQAPLIERNLMVYSGLRTVKIQSGRRRAFMKHIKSRTIQRPITAQMDQQNNILKAVGNFLLLGLNPASVILFLAKSNGDTADGGGSS